MIKLDRARVKAPPRWAWSVKRAFRDYAAFLARVLEFEALDVDDPLRRKGFFSYAPQVLFPKRGGGCDFKPIWRRVKDALAEMSSRKCPYCESPISAVRSAAVEHFKPKSLFPSLVYDLANYFLGCGGCNGAKSDKWPAGGGEYVRPDEGDPASLFVFWEDGTVQAAVPGSAADHTIRDFDLNREWLRYWREKSIRRALAELEELVNRTGLPQEVRQELAADVLTRHRSPDVPYSEAISQCLRRKLKESLGAWLQ